MNQQTKLLFLQISKAEIESFTPNIKTTCYKITQALQYSHLKFMTSIKQACLILTSYHVPSMSHRTWKFVLWKMERK